jgi:hypothetical protein
MAVVGLVAVEQHLGQAGVLVAGGIVEEMEAQQQKAHVLAIQEEP